MRCRQDANFRATIFGHTGPSLKCGGGRPAAAAARHRRSGEKGRAVECEGDATGRGTPPEAVTRSVASDLLRWTRVVCEVRCDQ